MKRKSNLLSNICMGLGIAAILLGLVIPRPQRHPSEKYVRSRVIQLEGEGYACTGEQVMAPSGRSYVLTAGHCNILKDKNGYIAASIDGSRPINLRVIEEDPKSDLMLLEGMPHLSGLEIAQEAPTGHMYTAYTHGGRLPTHRADGEYITKSHIRIFESYILDDAELQECKNSPKHEVYEDLYCLLSLDEIATSIKIEPGSSGGPIVDYNDQLVGVASASNSLFYFMVTLSDIHRFVSSY